MRLTSHRILWLKALLHLAAFLPLVWLIFAIIQGKLSADPVKDIQHFTGLMALKLLLITLVVAPLARYIRQPLLIRTRRLLGVWCFTWATLHLLSYSVLELGISNLSLLGQELVTRPYLTLGMISWVMLFALTLTSTRSAMKYLGSRWQKLHNSVYLILILVSIHFIWSVKILSPQPLLYALVALVLLALRYKKFCCKTN
ncbi:protein-methionine-sulfoxide reductase heme-binding subunit MsrQ [Citrobacter sp. JGM124]|uniref:protein-methionine-sulfoxide reductase heme-binding subunit MsrQ n=1 Tax=Citrobacter sp. JGM124 TaxID=2799789 RepID=UPI001BA684D5|nr:protein-methionine-sulfoxide reductase heme-binding subunit MsrQ [Citrobacter sp. JGM124]MBS0849560.1 protein-methionine-sulfoxide reductase heme-binding subunit MsrQ [Citrobacter sp. JGM124]